MITVKWCLKKTVLPKWHTSEKALGNTTVI